MLRLMIRDRIFLEMKNYTPPTDRKASATEKRIFQSLKAYKGKSSTEKESFDKLSTKDKLIHIKKLFKNAS